MSLKHVVLGLVLLATPAAADGVKVDESALRYYAAHNESERAAAEIRRLQALYPDWVPPADLGAAPVDREGPLWDIFRTGDKAALAKALEAAKAADPAFEPSADLKAQMARRDARDGLIAASEAGDAATVLSLADAHPDFIGCADLDVTWRVAAAAVAGQRERATGLYRQILQTCDGPQERIATVQKAIAALGRGEAHDLLSLARDPHEFDALRPDFARAAVAAQLTDGKGPDPEPADLAALEALAEAGPKPDDAAMLGWWHRGRKETDKAIAAFGTAATLAGAPLDPKIAEGLVLAYEDAGRRADAIRVAHDNRDRSEVLARLYVDLGTAAFVGTPRPRLSETELADYGTAVTGLRSAPGAEALAWYLHDLKRPAEASTWFDHGLEWAPSESLASGAVLSRAAAGDAPGARAIQQQWSAEFPALARLPLGGTGGKPAAGTGKDPILAAFQAGAFGRCVELAEARAKLKPDLMLIKGWCLMKLQRPSEAAVAFEAAGAGAGKVKADAAYGRSLALMASGRSGEAVATAMSGVAAPERRAEIGAAALADAAQTRFAAKDYRGALAALQQRAAFTAETADLAMLRGWCLWHLGQRAEARALFVRLDSLLSTRETRQAVATTGERS